MLWIGIILLGWSVVKTIETKFISKEKLLKQIKEIPDKRLEQLLYKVIEHQDMNNYDLNTDLNITNNKTQVIEQMLNDKLLADLIIQNKDKMGLSDIQITNKYSNKKNTSSQVDVQMVVYKDSRQTSYYRETEFRQGLGQLINSTIGLIETTQKNRSNYLGSNVNGQLLLEQSLQILTDMREPEVIAPENKYLTENQKQRLLEMLDIMAGSIQQLELPDAIKKEYLERIAEIKRRIESGSKIDEELVQMFNSLVRDIIDEHEVIDEHVSNQQMLDKIKRNVGNMKQAHKMLHQLVHLKRLFVKDREQIEDMEQLSFKDLNVEIMKLMDGNVGGLELYEKVKQKVDRLMQVKVPVLNGAKKQDQVQKWVWSAILSQKVNKLIDYLQEQPYYQKMIDTIVKVRQLVQDIIEDLIINEQSQLEQNYQKLWEYLQKLKEMSGDDPYVVELVKQIGSMLEFIRKLKQQPQLPENISYQELKMFQTYEYCSKIDKQRALIQEQIDNIAMKELFFVNLRFFYEITELLGDLMTNNSCQLKQIISKFMNSIKKNESERQKVEIQRKLEQFNNVRDNDENKISYIEIQNYLDFYKEYQQLYLGNKLGISGLIDRMNMTLQQQLLEQDKSVKLLEIYSKMVEISLELSFQQEFNHVYHQTMELRGTESLVCQYKQFFGFVIMFGKQLKEVNVSMDVSVFWFRVLFKYYLNLGRMLKQIHYGSQQKKELGELLDIHRQLFELLKSNIDANVVASYVNQHRPRLNLLYSINSPNYYDTYQHLLVHSIVNPNVANDTNCTGSSGSNSGSSNSSSSGNSSSSSDGIDDELKDRLLGLIVDIKRVNRQGGDRMAVKLKVQQIRNYMQGMDQAILAKIKAIIEHQYKIEGLILNQLFIPANSTNTNNNTTTITNNNTTTIKNSSNQQSDDKYCDKKQKRDKQRQATPKYQKYRHQLKYNKVS